MKKVKVKKDEAKKKKKEIQWKWWFKEKREHIKKVGWEKEVIE